MSSRITSGQLLIATGAVHQAVGVAVAVGVGGETAGRNLFAEVADAGVVGAIAPDPLRMACFWFLFFGLVVLMLGALMHRIERAGEPLPAWLGWQLAGLGLAGGLLIPASGFWLVIPQGWWIVRRSRAQRTTRTLKSELPSAPHMRIHSST